MDERIKDFILRIEPKDMQVHDNLAVNRYVLTDTEGRHTNIEGGARKGTFTVKEVSDGGTVPELKVINKGGDAVLLLDGEELSEPSRTGY
jgi:hypothetical protein